MARLVYGVKVANLYEHAGEVEAVFTSEVAACEYAQRRSGEKYRNSGTVTRWELDNPHDRDWLTIYEDGQQTHRNTRVGRPPSPSR